MKITKLLMVLALVIPITATAAGKTVYVGEGRYVGQDRTSSDSAVLRQRNQEQTERRQDRQRDESRSRENDRQERDYQRESNER